jgi:hypothetical protein
MMERDVDRRLQTPGDVLVAIRSCEPTLGGVATAGLTDTVPVRPTILAPTRARRGRFSSAVRVGAALGALAAVLILVTVVESRVQQSVSSGVLEDPTLYVQGPPDETPLGYSTEPPTVISLPPLPQAASPALPRPAPLALPTPAVAAAPPALPSLPDLPGLPRRPSVLVLVSGEESMVPAVRAHLESLLQGRGLRLVSAARYPVLREKYQAGRLSLYWYDVVALLPANTAQILVLAEIRKTGSTMLRYYGRSDEMMLASFSLRTIDATTGASIHSASAPSIQFTALNMGENLNQAIEPVVAGVDTKIEAYWKRRLEHDSS